MTCGQELVDRGDASTTLNMIWKVKFTVSDSLGRELAFERQ